MNIDKKNFFSRIVTLSTQKYRNNNTLKQSMIYFQNSRLTEYLKINLIHYLT